jgi:aromatic ring-opening dioxygenase catalytic subunit (LigB family)
VDTTTDERMPAIYISHGGGPCFFMDWDPPDAWDGLRAALEGIGPSLPHTPRAILVVTAHWESSDIAIDGGAAPQLIYDYGGFPAHTYQLTYPAPGAPDVARRAAGLLEAAGIAHHVEERGWDHGVFVPLKVMYPDADVPIVAMSVRHDLDPLAHLELGRALRPLRDEGVLIVGSGSSFHNFATFGSPRAAEFDDWLGEVTVLPDAQRRAALVRWEDAPAARIAHAREEHLVPLMVAAGAADDVPATPFFRGELLQTQMSCFRFD